MDPLLTLRGIGKHFGRLAVLRGLDLDLHAGEIVGLIGANGAGKSTLLSIIAGLMPPSRGERTFAGSDAGARDDRARFAVVSHTAQTYPRLTAMENLELFAKLRAHAGAHVEPLLPTLERLGLGYAAQRQAGTFSRGMLQRLALARALLGRPEMLLLDEPFTALDRPGRALLASVLAEERDRGAAILLISHDLEALVSVADRVVLLEGGLIEGDAVREPEAPSFAERVRALAGRMPSVGADTHASA
jgi:ABC-type multidrug transport system ATPase subunit